jgi:hypothetical protein
LAERTTRRAPAASSPPPEERGPRVWWQALPPRRRTLLRRLLAAGVLVVLAVGVVLARFLSVENAERNADLALVQAEAKGDAAAMLASLDGCRFRWIADASTRAAESRACRAAVKADARDPRVLRRGAIKILQLESATAYALFGATGKTRLAWTVIGTQPVVQCVEVRRSGNFLTGVHVQLLAIGRPISGEGKCTKETAEEREEEEATEVEEGKRRS